jgi:hypothetical protein
MRNRKRTTQANPATAEVANKEQARAKAYAAMTKDDVTKPAKPRDLASLPVAPNGRPYDPRSGRYADR